MLDTFVEFHVSRGTVYNDNSWILTGGTSWSGETCKWREFSSIFYGKLVCQWCAIWRLVIPHVDARLLGNNKVAGEMITIAITLLSFSYIQMRWKCWEFWYAILTVLRQFSQLVTSQSWWRVISQLLGGAHSTAGPRSDLEYWLDHTLVEVHRLFSGLIFSIIVHLRITSAAIIYYTTT